MINYLLYYTIKKILLAPYHVLRVLVPLSMWLGVRFLSQTCGKISVGRGESTLCTSHVSQQRLVVTNDDGKFVPISW
jgi:hypothetical protein